MKEWVLGQAKKIAGQEACTITESGLLKTTNKEINENFFFDYSIARLTQNLRSLAPTFFSIADAFSTTSRQEKSLSKGWAEKKNICLKVRLGPVIGCPGALTETETGLVITGYLTMEGSAILTLLKARSQKNNYAQAIHSTYLMATGAQCQHFTVFTSLGIGISYPSVITQLPKENKGILGWKNAQENGTCATIIPLHNATLEGLSTERLDEAIMTALPLMLEDLELNEAESELMNRALVHMILSVIVRYGGKGFEQWKADLDKSCPQSAETIGVHQTSLHPLPAMEIDKNTITGNVEVIDTIFTELHLDQGHEDFTKYVKIIAGNQLTIARQRSILNSKKPQEVPLPHIPKGDMVFENASLFMCDALLTRLFSDAIKSGDSGLIILVLKLWSFAYWGSGQLKYAHEMLHLLHNLVNVWTSQLRTGSTREHVSSHLANGAFFPSLDFVLTKTLKILSNFTFNALPPSELVDFGFRLDSSRIFHACKNCTRSRVLVHVFSHAIREHLNFWIKKVYKANGDGHSWEWLSLISPCIDVLWRLAKKIHSELGSQLGSKHTIPNLHKDIQTLMDALNEHEVYVVKEGRVLDANNTPVPNVISTGLAALAHGNATNPLAEFNAQYNSLRERRKLVPISDLCPISANMCHPESSTAVPIPAITEQIPANETGLEDEYDGLPKLAITSDSEDEEDREDPYDEDLFADSPTLTRLEEEDVVLELDDLVLDDSGMDWDSDEQGDSDEDLD
ncbi:uncharacterized protein LACBIDRAFT_327646 [Laccaria bicolor S238N-H82]|uniref:Predicted protein n=1 Tax=Laccaria bicolor (strain S238N-H82 / ATCC MYA-4686) TaxID=486041 RepID=B0DCE2_LACBS|nr:uncharacterized protein LACBIDRAFT_327646 [Laccaria bicolor S238N-H82]EDR07713.1 predicted protein [Laccaria bicolor S238N-H82]|eukprot:XP_001881502.1 predicted protein [Laccaria bicolor S238N-H82]